MNPSVTRSLARAVHGALPDFQIAVAGTSGEPAFERPFVAIVNSSPAASTPHGPSHAVFRAGYSVVAYPYPGLTDDASRVEAERVARLLLLEVVGERLDLYDYSGTPYFAVGPDEAVAVARVEEPNVSITQAGGGWIVALDVRLRWSERVRDRPTGPTAQRVGVRRAA